MRPALRLAKTVALSLALAALALPAAAAEARATGTLPIHAGPGQHYRVIGKLPDGTYVGLSDCTRRAVWCKIIWDDGPNGWVLGSYLVGNAKLGVTPPEFTNPFFAPF